MEEILKECEDNFCICFGKVGKVVVFMDVVCYNREKILCRKRSEAQ